MGRLSEGEKVQYEDRDAMFESRLIKNEGGGIDGNYQVITLFSLW